MEVIRWLHKNAPETVSILLTGHGSLESAVTALRSGAHDYLFKPCSTVRLRESIRGGLLKRRERLMYRRLASQLEDDSSVQKILEKLVKNYLKKRQKTNASESE